MERKPALFIIDMVNDSFLHHGLNDQRKNLCENINRLLTYSRALGHSIFWVKQEYKADLSDAFLEMREQDISMYIEATPGSDFVSELQPLEGEQIIIKKRYSMYYGTNLDQLLVDLRPSELILAGVNSHACIRTAAIDAYQRDFRSIIVNNCVGSTQDEHHKVTMGYLSKNIAKLVSLNEFISGQDIVGS